MGGGTDDVGGPVCVCGWQQSLEVRGRRGGGEKGGVGGAIGDILAQPSVRIPTSRRTPLSKLAVTVN